MLYQSASLEICIGVDVAYKRHQVAIGLSTGQLLDGMTAGTVLEFNGFLYANSPQLPIPVIFS